MNVNDMQIGGDHYSKSAFQMWDLASRHTIGFLEGCAIKYVSRWRSKNGATDLEKAQHFLMKIEDAHEFGYAPTGTAGPRVLSEYFEANGITDFREKIVISILAADWKVNQLNHAALALGSLIDTARSDKTNGP